MSSKVYGVIGLGAMGMGMAKSLVRAGLKTYGYDLHTAALESFSAAGGNSASSSAEVAANSDVLFLVVVNANQVESVLLSENGILKDLRPGSVVICCSTVSPDFSRSMADILSEHGILMLDAPISGGAKKALEGQITVMASGPTSAFEKAEVGLKAISAVVYQMGDEAGKGSAMKIVNQLLAGVHIAAAAESLALGLRMGLDADKVYEVITHAAGNSWMFENRVPHILNNDYTPLSAVDIFVKDLRLVLESAGKVNFPAPLSATAHQQFINASAAGYGAEDDSAVIKIFPGIKLPAGKN